MKEALLLTIAIYMLAGATIYAGVLTTVVLFLYPSWKTLRPETIPGQFTIPIGAATRFFKAAIPTWAVALVALLVNEWGDHTVWPVLVALFGLVAAAAVFVLLIRPVNLRIQAGPDHSELPVLMGKWMKLNTIRWAATVVIWVGMCWYFVAKGDLLAAMKG
jgi:hypothetical protein